MRHILFKIFDVSFGKIIRLFQRSLIPNTSSSESLLNLVRREAVLDSLEFARSNLREAMMFEKRSELWEFCVLNSKIIGSKQNSLILEFGVWRGESINFISNLIPNQKIYGFDSFLGLQEDWTGHSILKHTFSTQGKLPKVNQNVQLIKGCYEDTLPDFLANRPFAPISILHMDSDTYTPTKFVLKNLMENLIPGSIIIFDDFFGYPNWQSHEYRAWSEITLDMKLNFKYIGYTNNQLAVEFY